MSACPICGLKALITHTRMHAEKKVKDWKCVQCGRITTRDGEVLRVEHARTKRGGSGVIAPPPYRRGTRWGAGY